MDLGMVGVVDGSVGFSDTYCLPASSATTTTSLASDLETKNQKWYGSGFLKQERPSSGGAYNGEDEEWKNLIKVAKADDFSSSRAMQQQLQNQKRADLVPEGQQMLSFSSPNSQAYYHHSASANTRSFAGYGSGGLNAASMNGVLAGVLRGPFTPSQWMELEHQALIYKYITANVPIPSNLLIPIKKALESAGFPSFSGPLGHSSLGWGAFRLGFSNSTDPEPGRCRRTDGKKWRCSRDAVQDHKYCERHMNRGRHRSRKPVEGQNGSGPAAAATKHIPASTSTPSMAVPGGGASNTIGFSNHHPQLKNLQTGASNTCTTSPHIDRMFLNKENVGERHQDATDLSMLPPAIGLKDNQFSIPKQQNNIYQESARSEFGRVCSDSLLNPLHKSSTLVSCRNYGSSSQDQEDEPQYSVRQFMDDWPKNQTDRSSISWPHMDNLQADRTQLSISILPTTTSDNEKLALSPLRLSRELEMGLGVGSVVSEQNERQASWMPLPCESSMGGPLGEVLHSSNNAGDYKNSSALNLMTGTGGGWDSSPPLGSSPTGVLQKVTFRSLSNSSAGSSPRAESHRIDHHP